MDGSGPPDQGRLELFTSTSGYLVLDSLFIRGASKRFEPFANTIHLCRTACDLVTNSVSRATSFFVTQIPAQTEGVGRLVVLTLSEILRAAIVEPEDRVVQIQPGDRRREAFPEVNATLRVHLKMRVKGVVA